MTAAPVGRFAVPDRDQAAAARTAGLKPEQVTLHTMMAGGGFGRRAVPTSDFVEAVAIAKAYKAAGKSGPVKMIWSREDDIKGGYYRPAHVHRADIGLDDKGNIVGWDHVIVGQSIISRHAVRAHDGEGRATMHHGRRHGRTI
jgi:isoquinoline 1-oxidoreductase beta subunit